MTCTIPNCAKHITTFFFRSINYNKVDANFTVLFALLNDSDDIDGQVIYYAGPIMVR